MLDSSFDSSVGIGGSGQVIYALALQDDGKIVVGGNFTSYNGSPANDIARLMGDLYVSWADGESGSKSVALPIVDDALVEGDETVTLSLTALNGASLGTPSTQTLTILDNDGAPTATPTTTPTSTPGTPTATPTSTPERQKMYLPLIKSAPAS